MKYLKVISGLLLCLILLTGCGSSRIGITDFIVEESFTVEEPIDFSINKSAIQVYSNETRPDYPKEATLDEDRSTFWTTINVSFSGHQIKWLSYKFDKESNLKSIELINDYVDTYTYGDLTIQVSKDSTNGQDGTWLDVISLTESSTYGSGLFLAGDGIITFNVVENINWVRLYMIYTGSGTYGGGPSFYLSEINFNI